MPTTKGVTKGLSPAVQAAARRSSFNRGQTQSQEGDKKQEGGTSASEEKAKEGEGVDSKKEGGGGGGGARPTPAAAGPTGNSSTVTDKAAVFRKGSESAGER